MPAALEAENFLLRLFRPCPLYRVRLAACKEAQGGQGAPEGRARGDSQAAYVARVPRWRPANQHDGTILLFVVRSTLEGIPLYFFNILALIVLGAGACRGNHAPNAM